VFAKPRAAHAVFLGDGVSLDRVEGFWRDRFCEPLIAALAARDRTSFLMQGGTPVRQPWSRAAFPANLLSARGLLRAWRHRQTVALPGLDQVHTLLRGAGADAPSLARAGLEREARQLLSTAEEFVRVLAVVRPQIAFVVNYYSGLGPAFVLACRRLRILSVDVQHCPNEGTHMAYATTALPASGYSLLPAMFWTWTRQEADSIDAWTRPLTRPWHRSFAGGHPQLAPFLDDDDPATCVADQHFRSVGGGARFEREILVALQTLHGQRGRWSELTAAIEASPRTWRWWIRRHPASTPEQDAEYRALLELRGVNVVHAEASMPLPGLLRHMNVVVSLVSGVAREAAFFGVPALFLDEEARARFPRLFETGHARIVAAGELHAAVATAPALRRSGNGVARANLADAVSALEGMAAGYAALFRPEAPGG
jgi:hypothetical protein